MSTETQPTLTDDEIETVWKGTGTATAVADPQDADGTDGGDADGTDSDGSDGDATDSADGDAGDADGQDA
jgi:hypothetical protein